MKKIIKNHDGFGALEIILVVAVLGLIGFTVYNAYNQRHKAATISNQNSQPPIAKKTTAPTAPADPYAGWGSYTSQSTAVTLKYPNTYLASTNNTALFLGTSQSEKQQNDACAKASECNDFNFGITVHSFKKNAGETYSDAVKRNSYNPSTNAISKISGYKAYQDAEAVTAEVGGGYLSFVFIDLPNRVVLIQGQFSQRSNLSAFNKIVASASIQP
jgi:hypothetical protein